MTLPSTAHHQLDIHLCPPVLVGHSNLLLILLVPPFSEMSFLLVSIHGVIMEPGFYALLCKTPIVLCRLVLPVVDLICSRRQQHMVVTSKYLLLCVVFHPCCIIRVLCLSAYYQTNTHQILLQLLLAVIIGVLQVHQHPLII